MQPKTQRHTADYQTCWSNNKVLLQSVSHLHAPWSLVNQKLLIDRRSPLIIFISWIFRLRLSLTMCYMLPAVLAHVRCVCVCVCSGWKPELQLQFRRPVRQRPLPAAPSAHVQALFCVSGQVLGVSLRRQRL